MYYVVRIDVVLRHSVFFQAEDGIRDLVRSRGLGDVYKRQVQRPGPRAVLPDVAIDPRMARPHQMGAGQVVFLLSLIHI